jgi:peptidoglycan/xylan/chitin deacetylase (PgdA/CDA1 family)
VSARARPLLRRAAVGIAGSPPSAALIGAIERADRPAASLLSVLMYHRVDEPAAAPLLDPALISATPDAFEAQIAYLAAHRPCLSLDDLLAVRRAERTLPPGAVMVTFDDAYRDFLAHAWPVLRRHGVPATLFVATAYPGDPSAAFWWDRLWAALNTTERRGPVDSPAGPLSLSGPDERRAAARRLREWVWATPHVDAMAGLEQVLDDLGAPPARGSVLDWDALRALQGEGVAIAGHTRTHPMLNRLSTSEAQEEILGSLADLERELGSAPPAFAFPAGGYTRALADWTGEAGLELAFTTERGVNDLREGAWRRLRRINIGPRTSLPVLRLQLLPSAGRVQAPLLSARRPA